MILYCDTSALVKLYIEENGSALLRQRADTSSVIAVCRIARAETLSALARRTRECPEDGETIAAARTRLREDWPNYAIMEVTQPIGGVGGGICRGFRSARL